MFTLKTIGQESSALFSNLCVKTFVQAYKDVHSKTNLESYCRENYTEDKLKQSLGDSNTAAVIAFEESEVAGFYAVKHHNCPVELDGQSSELKQIYVLSDFYGGGLGRRLFDDAIDRAKDYGSQWLWLCVSDINYQALAFYKKLGFTSIGKGPTLYVGSDRLSSSILSLKLQSNQRHERLTGRDRT